MPNQSTAMAVLASEQIMPNLEGLLSFHRIDTPITHLFIYHTTDERRSAKPAHRIRQMAENFFPDLKVTLHQPEKNEDGKHPDLVYTAIDQWYQSVPAEYLVINATGGLKTMFAGVLNFLNTENTNVIYRDLDGTWLKLLMHTSILQSEPIEVNRLLLDMRIKNLGIKNLVKIQSGFTDIHSTKPRAMDCVETLKKVIQNQWQWRSVAAEKESAGSTFEQWFASLVSTFDIDDLVVGLEPYDKSRAQMETDIWVLKNAQLYTFDLKLIAKKQQKSSLAEQITNASAQAGKFAGLNVKTILIRPGYSFLEDDAKSLKALAARFSCDIWFQEDMINLLTKLQRLFKQPSLEHDSITALFKKSSQQQGFLISNPDFLASLGRSESGKKALPLALLFSKVESLGYKWVGISLSSEQYFFHITQQDEYKIKQWVTKLNKNGCNAKKVSSNQLMVQARNEPGKQYLREHRSRTTMDSLFSWG